MEKIRFDLDELEVESFETTEHSAGFGTGTVRGYHTLNLTCDIGCTGAESCEPTCGTEPECFTNEESCDACGSHETCPDIPECAFPSADGAESCGDVRCSDDGTCGTIDEPHCIE